jgi:hypothetical protein
MLHKLSIKSAQREAEAKTKLVLDDQAAYRSQIRILNIALAKFV